MKNLQQLVYVYMNEIIWKFTFMTDGMQKKFTITKSVCGSLCVVVNLSVFNILGQTFVPTDFAVKEGKTSPPDLLTEAELIAMMDKHGIGTDATHADHINTIIERGTHQ